MSKLAHPKRCGIRIREVNKRLGAEPYSRYFGGLRPSQSMLLENDEEPKREGPPGWYYPEWVKAHPETLEAETLILAKL